MNKFWKFVFWAPRVAYDFSSLAHSNKSIPLFKIIYGSLGTLLLAISAVAIMNGGDISISIGIKCFVLYVIQGFLVMFFYKQYHNEYLP